MNQTTRNRIRISKPASTAAVRFTDGMLVTAEDLTAAMHYPLAVVQVLLKSHLGCGIVCGLEVTDLNRERPDRPRSEQGDHAQNETDADYEPTRGFMVQIDRGVALGCDAYPIELCRPVELDLAPDPCGCPIADGAIKVKYIAIRRESAPEAPARGCGCGPAAGDPGQLCSRVGDHVLVEAFDSLPEGICMEADEREWTGTCACLRTCPSCEGCTEPWVLLATVQISRDGLVSGGINHQVDVKSSGGRAYVKPIACACAGEKDLAGRYEKLVERIGKLEARLLPQGQSQSPTQGDLTPAAERGEIRAEAAEAAEAGGQAPEATKPVEEATPPIRRGPATKPDGATKD